MEVCRRIFIFDEKEKKRKFKLINFNRELNQLFQSISFQFRLSLLSIVAEEKKGIEEKLN